MIIMGGLTAVAFFIFVLKLPTAFRRRLLGFDLLVDIAATIAMMLAFAGSFSGMAAAIVGGLIFSAFLLVAKFIGGYEKAIITRRQGKIHFVWLPVPGVFSKR